MEVTYLNKPPLDSSNKRPVNFRNKKLSIVLFLVFIIVIFVFYLGRNLIKTDPFKLFGGRDGGSTSEGIIGDWNQESTFGELLLSNTEAGDYLVRISRIGYDSRVGLPKNQDGLIDIYSVVIKSTGDVYTKEITVDNGVVVTLFILKGRLENNLDVDAVVGINSTGFFDGIEKNWWLRNLMKFNNGLNEMPGRIDFSKVSLNEDSLETQFDKDSFWNYSFYFDNRILVLGEYKEIIKKIYGDTDSATILSDLRERGETDLPLFPF